MDPLFTPDHGGIKTLSILDFLLGKTTLLSTLLPRFTESPRAKLTGEVECVEHTP